ncbi:hypothetical protein [Shimazuella kribbensis]|uniref:hypothetical protein n=1 Tax=Shimazuella kribbensis TaxID=139808 RepID=UPI0012EB0EFD|nr:hypothetical protein [Shimazuella kribbensis]
MFTFSVIAGVISRYKSRSSRPVEQPTSQQFPEGFLERLALAPVEFTKPMFGNNNRSMERPPALKVPVCGSATTRRRVL